MRKPEQNRVIKGLMSHLDHGTNVDAGSQVRNPTSAYTDPSIAAREWREFFQQHTQVMGLSADLPEKGSFFTSNDLGKPILCTRDKDGEFHAFLNVCSHRGTVLENERRGRRSVFSCPFHAWSYSPKGDLVSVPKEDHFGPVDKSCHGLVALPAEEKYGLLFVHPDKDGELDIDGMLGDLADELDAWDLGSYSFQFATCYEHAMNWKLAIDTFGETYHFEALHKNTLAADVYGNVQMYDTYKRNHRMALCLRNIENLREQQEDDWHILQAAIPVYYLFPNIQLIFGRGGPTLVRVYPDLEDPHNSHSQISFYLHPMVQEMAHREDQKELYRDINERMEGFAEVIRDEDYAAAATSHQGAVSGALQYFIFGRNEPALHHYHNTYREALGLPPLERISHQ